MQRSHSIQSKDRDALTTSAGRKPSGKLPDYKARLNRYLELARLADGAGDKVLSENYYQHAEPFFRMSQGESA